MSDDQVNESIFSTELIVNIVLHVAILFTILSFFFKLMIAKLSSDAINHEIEKSVEDSITPLFKEKDIIKNKINSLIAEYNKLKIELNSILPETINRTKNFINKLDLNNQLVDNNQINNNIVENIRNKMNIILLQINNLEIMRDSLPANIAGSILPTITIDDVINYIKQFPFPFDYYLELFSKDHPARKRVNIEVFRSINITNFLIILFLIIIVSTLFYTNNLTYNQFKHILLENVITFTFVGIIEVIFFFFIALKFVPAPPSLILTSLIENISNKI